LPNKAEPLIDVREADSFAAAKRDVEAALIHARPYAKTEEIQSWEEAKGIADEVKCLRIAIDVAEEARKELNAPYEATVKHNNAHFKELLKQAEAAVGTLKPRVAKFKAAKEAEERERRRKEQERLDREAEARAAEAQKAAEQVAQEPTSPEARQEAADAHMAAAKAATATAAPVNPPKQVRGNFGGIGTRTEYDITVTDPKALTREFLMFNEKAAKAAVKGERAMAKAQERDFNLDLIPGVTITPREVPVSR